MNRTGIIAPMPVEAAPLVPAAALASKRQGPGFPVYEWASPEGRVSLACSGIGPRKGARAARYLLEEVGVDRLVVCGLAGGLVPTCRIGTLVLPQEVCAYSADLAGGFVAQGALDRAAVGPAYPVDARLWRAALETSGSAPLTGLLVTVGGLVTSPPILDWFQKELGASAVDMESAAVGEVCAQAGVPFLVVRALSDHAPELARWDWPSLARSRKRGGFPLTAYCLRHPRVAVRLWRLRHGMGRGAQVAAFLVTRLLSKP